MTSLEKKIWSFVLKHLELILIVIGLIVSFVIRYHLRGFVSEDMEDFLLPWYEKIKSMGGMRALSEQVGNYNITYQVFTGLATLIPIKPIYAYKIFSIIFDYLLGCTIAWLTWIVTKRKMKAVFAFVISINLPMVFSNSAMWGQCDSIYAFWSLLAIVLLIKKKIILCYIAYGIACAFKLQAVFLLPFFLFNYVEERNHSLWMFFLIPITMIILSLPAIVQGRPLSDVFTIYQQQTETYKKISMNYPSFWTLSLTNKDEQFYELVKNPAILITFLAIIIEIVFFFRNSGNTNKASQTIMQCFVICYTCVLFLPSMHERYDYLPVILGLILAFIVPKSIFLFICLSIINLKAYSDYLFGVQQNWEILSVLNVLVFVGYMLLIMKLLSAGKGKPVEEGTS